MRVRTYDEIDPLEAFRLSLLSFGDAWNERKIRRVRQRNKMYLDEFALYAEERGRLLAQVVPLRFRVRLATGVEEVGGLGGICSHPAVWGRGYARRLIDQAHARFRELGLRISTLTSSRNIRGYGVYSKMGYADLAPFRSAVRRVHRSRKPKGYELRRAKLSDLADIHRLYQGQTRDMLGWTERPGDLIAWKVFAEPSYLSKYRMVTKGGTTVGYLRTRPDDGVTMDEVVARSAQDFRAAVAVIESTARGGIATVDWITADEDVSRFRRLGYIIDGPIPDATMALSLTEDLRTAELPRLFGGTSGRFVQYRTDDF